jgi:transposase-like protein
MGALSPRKRSRQYKAAERAEFFRRLDRGGTIRAVAAELGLSPDTCYRWRHESGTSTARSRSRGYSAADKAEFFRRRALNPNVSAVARDLGFVRVTCYKWAHQAGIFTGKDVTAQREEFLRLRAEGLSRAQAAAGVGVDKRRAQDWDKGIRQFYGGRVYPDGRVVRYGQAAILAAVKTPRTAYTRGIPDDLEQLERPTNCRFLSLGEREQIHDLHVRGDSIRAIARALDRAPSTIGRELARNTATVAGYLPYAAHRLAVARRPRPRPGKLQVLAVLRVWGRSGRWSRSVTAWSSTSRPIPGCGSARRRSTKGSTPPTAWG